MVNLICYLQNPNLSIHDEHYADDMSLLGSNTKDGFLKTATTFFFRKKNEAKMLINILLKRFAFTLNASSVK